MHLPGTSRARAAVIATATAALVISTPSFATAKTVDDAQLTPRTHFVLQPLNPDRSAPTPASDGDAIPNIDIVKATIRTYYNATKGIADKDSSPYITQLEEIEADALADLPTVDPSDNKAVVFDADDTTLWTYDMEDGAMHFNFDPAIQNDEWVQPEKFPATPGMVAFVKAVAEKGYHVYGITGRGANQEDATLGNLDKVGYTEFNADNFYTKWAGDTPAYVDCTADGSAADSCSTVEYKAFTRKHIQDADGMDIVLNIGDQYSDLQGGYSDEALKLPNPTYYLPSPNIAGAPASDAELTLPTEFDMAADGSSGLTTPGDQIPNIDNDKGAIQAYYDATHGIADKHSSLYISQMKQISRHWAHRLHRECRTGSRHHQKPAVVFDADETTLWGYDMEDGAMHFNFDPTIQNDEWVQPERFPAVPGMVKVVRHAANAGCKIIGITGRGANQRLATIDNLAKVGYYSRKTDRPLFKSQYYFTKWSGSAPEYVDPTVDGKDGYSTIDYKASTRKHVEDHFGFDIIANFGDQYSDLIGGSSDRVVKLPNPTYYLP